MSRQSLTNTLNDVLLEKAAREVAEGRFKWAFEFAIVLLSLHPQHPKAKVSLLQSAQGFLQTKKAERFLDGNVTKRVERKCAQLTKSGRPKRPMRHMKFLTKKERLALLIAARTPLRPRKK